VAILRLQSTQMEDQIDKFIKFRRFKKEGSEVTQEQMVSLEDAWAQQAFARLSFSVRHNLLRINKLMKKRAPAFDSNSINISKQDTPL
jgi:hypothetical protein